MSGAVVSGSVTSAADLSLADSASGSAWCRGEVRQDEPQRADQQEQENRSLQAGELSLEQHREDHYRRNRNRYLTAQYCGLQPAPRR